MGWAAFSLGKFKQEYVLTLNKYTGRLDREQGKRVFFCGRLVKLFLLFLEELFSTPVGMFCNRNSAAFFPSVVRNLSINWDTDRIVHCITGGACSKNSEGMRWRSGPLCINPFPQWG